MSHTDHTRMVPYLLPGRILSREDATDAIGILKTITAERDALEKKLSQVFPQVHDAVVTAVPLSPASIWDVEKAIAAVQRRFGS